MDRRERYISASQIADYKFCKRALYLASLGTPSQLTIEREAGCQWHESHADRVAVAPRFRTLARIFAAAFFALLTIALLHRILAP
ncbi:MAG: hypothetical protein ACRD7E_00015 [Bryobacteraceae bacterium]